MQTFKIIDESALPLGRHDIAFDSTVGLDPYLAVLHSFRVLAPNIAPTPQDVESMVRLAEDIRATLKRFGLAPTHPVYIAEHPDSDLEGPTLQVRICNCRPVQLADVWIEFVNTPMAFFYWES